MVFKFNFELSNCVEKNEQTTSAKFIPIKHIFRACLFQQSLKRKRKENCSIIGALKIQPDSKYRSRFERTVAFPVASTEQCAMPRARSDSHGCTHCTFACMYT